MRYRKHILVIGALLLIIVQDSVAESDNTTTETNKSDVSKITAAVPYFLNPSELLTQVNALTSFITESLIAVVTPGTIIPFNGTHLVFPDLSVFRQIFIGGSGTVQREGICTGCQVFLGSVIRQIRILKASPQSLISMTVATCKFFKIAHPEICEGAVQRFMPTLHWIIKTREGLTSIEMCGMFLQQYGCHIPKEILAQSDLNWNLESAKKAKPEKGTGLNISSDGFRKIPEANDDNNNKKETKKSMKILHLADLHIDYDYLADTKSECENEVLCCHEGDGFAIGDEKGAGFFGDNAKCDAPISVLYSALKHIQMEHGSDIDIIYMAGDLVPHNVWYTTVESNSKIIRDVSRVIYDYFPTARVIPCLGNHEPHPINCFSPVEDTQIPMDLRTDWVYRVAYESWKQWIPLDQKDNFLSAGHYSVEINEHFRVLVFNSNLCCVGNPWQLYKPQDPGGQLQWLEKELELSALENKTVHLVSHVPPGHEDCYKIWSREFYKIVSKYRHIIRAQFYGHTHNDEFRLLHDPQDKTQPISALWISPSLTPYLVNNPAYRIYHIDLGHESPVYGDVIDHETWIYDLESVNKDYLKSNGSSNGTQDVKWFQFYKATEAYQLKNLLLPSLKELVLKMARERKTFDLYYKYFLKATDPKQLKSYPCDRLCQKKILCGIVQAYYDDDDGQVECTNIQKEVDGKPFPLKMWERFRKLFRF